jgi:N-lysine methyltransferase SETD6
MLISQLVAKSDIHADEVLFTIPRSAILSVQTSELARRLPQVFEDPDEPASADEESNDDAVKPQKVLDPWASLILVMIYEHLQPQSNWKKYLDVLPEHFDTPMFWSEREMSELQASSMTAKVGKDEADIMFSTKVIPIMREHSDLFAGAAAMSDDDALQLAHRMGSTIMSYAFDLENEDENENEEDGWVEDREDKTLLGMVPMADILNADAEFNVSHYPPLT